VKDKQVDKDDEEGLDEVVGHELIESRAGPTLKQVKQLLEAPTNF
jgi:hypothetical protein